MVRYLIILILLFLLFRCQNKLPFLGHYPSRGLATWYDPRISATGEKYDEGDFTCAMRKRDFGKYYVVCNLENNKCVEVKHNDFGPSAPLFWGGRIIDLSRRAFSKIADLEKGVVRVRLGEVHYAAEED